MKLPPIEKLRIVKYPDPVLKKRTGEVTEFTAGLRALADRMLELMRQAEGVGLAAPQVGVLLRLFVCNPTGEPGHDMVCVNPKLSRLDGADDAPEGCLSLPGVTVTMRRAVGVTLDACGVSGKPFRVPGEGLLARVWQHEYDHLDGRLIVDRMSETDQIANRRAIRQLKEDYAALRS